MMQKRKANDAVAPSSRELAAYADGELDMRAAVRVRDWLADHPEAAAGLEEQRHLDQLCRATVPAEPDETTWLALRQRIEKQTAALRARRPARLTWLRALLPLGAAAALLLALMLHQPATLEPKLSAERSEPWPVATEADVEIVSLEDADASALVVGQPPLMGPIVLVGPGDTSEIQIAPDVDGMIPTVAKVSDGMSTTMVVAPLPAEDKESDN